MTQQTLVAGIRASGKLHIGHYLGLIKQLLDTQADPNNRCFYFIADLHGITTPFESKELSQNTLDIAATYLSLGIDPNKTTFFLQNHVLEHATLAWIFNCITPLGELYRMTQFKDKVEQQTSGGGKKVSMAGKIGIQISQNKEVANAGLLTYPCLMAADILLYKPSAVPVGEDQVQHVELARLIAKKFNGKFGKIFPEPQTYLRKPLRIMSLQDPTKKMSKTGDEALLLDDTREEIQRKLKKAVTASDASGKASAGVDNLFLLMNSFSPEKTKKYFADKQTEGLLQYSELKQTLADDIYNFFAEFREKKKELLNKPDYLAEILGDGASRARKVAGQTLLEVKQKIGLL
ncbi:MAG: tryptophan--tRNA ligase [Candidatus Doudnabacteria bacterium]|nr:tryptophan--tRNA ligase [Candidatus Doudnabacteria bacterium]